jgi:hypothetical protein
MILMSAENLPTRSGLTLLRNPAKTSGKAHRRSVRGADLTACSAWARDMVEVPAGQVADEDRCLRCEKIHGALA